MEKGGFKVMNNKELKKLSRKELLEIMLSQAKRIEELEVSLKKVTTELNSKKISIEESGSIAEAALRLNNVFEVAQKSADQYLESVRSNGKKLEMKMQKDYEKEKQRMLKKVEKECEKKRKEADCYVKEVEQRIKEMAKDNKEIVLKKPRRKKKSV